MGRDRQPPHVRAWQTVLNEVWPENPMAFSDHPGIPVTVRIRWGRDGEEWRDGTAKRWDAEHVYVEVDDYPKHRLMDHGVWVRPADVRRRTP
jgi:hypothetical protein